MPTMDDFEAVVALWCGRMETPVQKEQMRAAFDPLRQAFQDALVQPNVKAANGMLRCIQSFDLFKPLSGFLKVARRLGTAAVPMHRIMASGLGYEGISMPFYELAALFQDQESLLVTLNSMTCIANLPQAAGRLGACFSCAVMDVSHNLLYDTDMHPCDRDRLVAARIRNLAAFLLRVRRDMPAIAQRYSNWEPTGSDPHCRGRTALILHRGAEHRMLKPRSMIADQSLTAPLIGADAAGIIPAVNRIMIEERMELSVPLATLDVQCVAGPDFGLEEFAQQKDTLAPAQAVYVFEHFGALAFLTKLFGCTDLHQDNVMVTNKGPVILDAECLFLPGVISSRELDATLLLSAVNGIPNAFGEPSVSHFRVDGELPAEAVQTAYRAGFVVMQRLCARPGVRVQLVQLLLEALMRGPTVRIVPIDTGELAADLIAFPRHSEEIVADTLRQVTEALGPTVRLDPDEQHAAGGLARRALAEAFLQGDIPALQIHIDLGRDSPFLINGQRVGTYTGYRDFQVLKQAFLENLDWLCSLRPDDLPVLAPRFG